MLELAGKCWYRPIPAHSILFQSIRAFPVYCNLFQPIPACSLIPNIQSPISNYRYKFEEVAWFIFLKKTLWSEKFEGRSFPPPLFFTPNPAQRAELVKIAPSYPPSLPPHAYIKERQQQPPSTPKITSTLFLPVTYKGDGISASKRARELILGSNWGRIQFPIHWCTLQVLWPHQGRTLPVERSPLIALVAKLVFSVSIGWQPKVPPRRPSP